MAWQAAHVLSLRVALAWCAAQAVVLAVLRHDSQTAWPVTAAYVVTYGGLGFFAALAAHLARSEARSRTELAETLNELQAAQGLLAGASRHAERLRLARELHDGMGHRLTALSLNLETARQQMAGGLPEPAQRAQELARDLLGELRGVVGALRDEECPELADALRSLTSGVERPRVHFNLIGELPADDGARVHALVRCMQELVTNVLRHANAENAWVDVVVTSEGVALKVRDDGCGGVGFQEGHGFAGIRERLATLGGRLTVVPGATGFQASVWLPHEAVLS